MKLKVKSKTTIVKNPTKVYDLSVPDYHNFILSNGIVVHNCDSFQSSQIKQQLVADGFEVDTISVDRLDTESKICLPYAYFKSTLYEKRLSVYKDCDLLTDEVLGLERESDGHIQHPEGGTQGSKDLIDAVVGSLYNASLHADEFAFEYGEDLDATIEVGQSNQKVDRKQIQMDMEEILKSLDPMQETIHEEASDETYFKNYGMGAAQQLTSNSAFYVMNGIIV